MRHANRTQSIKWARLAFGSISFCYAVTAFAFIAQSSWSTPQQRLMASVSQRIPNFLGGFSQQPDSLKLPGQLTQADNCLPDPTYGLLRKYVTCTKIIHLLNLAKMLALKIYYLHSF